MTERERLIELINRFSGATYTQNAVDSGLVDFLLKNGVIVPPVELGDTVWDNYFGYPESYTVTGFDVGKTMDDEVEHKELFVYYQNWNGSITCGVPISVFGKTVFLTCEEAKKTIRKEK